jgi:hypothetical protein
LPCVNKHPRIFWQLLACAAALAPISFLPRQKGAKIVERHGAAAP